LAAAKAEVGEPTAGQTGQAGGAAACASHSLRTGSVPLRRSPPPLHSSRRIRMTHDAAVSAELSQTRRAPVRALAHPSGSVGRSSSTEGIHTKGRKSGALGRPGPSCRYIRPHPMMATPRCRLVPSLRRALKTVANVWAACWTRSMSPMLSGGALRTWQVHTRLSRPSLNERASPSPKGTTTIMTACRRDLLRRLNLWHTAARALPLGSPEKIMGVRRLGEMLASSSTTEQQGVSTSLLESLLDHGVHRSSY
jgi:hypothetical protein